jgi:hypothetical protein
MCRLRIRKRTWYVALAEVTRLSSGTAQASGFTLGFYLNLTREEMTSVHPGSATVVLCDLG